MFSKAVSIAGAFTRPVVMSSRTTQGACAATIGAYVVVNPGGWILTAGHLLDIVREHQDSARRHAGYRGNVVEFHRDIAADKRYRKKGVRTFHKPGAASVRNHSVWWGVDGVRLVEARIVPAADLALGRLEPFDAKSVAHYPRWKNPSRGVAPGRSLCKLGFPLHRIVPVYDETANTFTLPRGRGAAAALSVGRDVHPRGPYPRARERGRRAERVPRDVDAEPPRTDGRPGVRCASRGVGDSVAHDAPRARLLPARCRAQRRDRSSISSSTPGSRCTQGVIRRLLDAEGIDYSSEE